MPIPKVKGNEAEETYIGRCMSAIGSEYDDQTQPLAICYATYRKATMQSLTDPKDRVAQKLKFNSDFRGINLQEGDFENPCWEGYTMVGTKIVDGREVPNCVPESEDLQAVGKEIDVLGYKTKNFTICPGATALFEHLMTMPMDDDTTGMIRSAAQTADNIFAIEKTAIETETTTPEQLKEAMVLVEDFKDLMEEIDEEVGMRHDTAFMDRHIDVIKSFM